MFEGSFSFSLFLVLPLEREHTTLAEARSLWEIDRRDVTRKSLASHEN
jgi:hypothetical protein